MKIFKMMKHLGVSSLSELWKLIDFSVRVHFNYIIKENNEKKMFLEYRQSNLNLNNEIC